MPRDWNLPLAYPPKIEAVRTGQCIQTIRFCTISKSKKHLGEIIRKQVGDRVRFYRWTGRPYWSHPEYITGYMELIDVINIDVFPWGIHGGHLSPTWSNNTYIMNHLAARDFIDPPTGEALRDVLIGTNGKIPEKGAPAQILRWKPL
jgi:hypothetical protein